MENNNLNVLNKTVKLKKLSKIDKNYLSVYKEGTF